MRKLHLVGISGDVSSYVSNVIMICHTESDEFLFHHYKCCLAWAEQTGWFLWVASSDELTWIRYHYSLCTELNRRCQPSCALWLTLIRANDHSVHLAAAGLTHYPLGLNRMCARFQNWAAWPRGFSVMPAVWFRIFTRLRLGRPSTITHPALWW